MKLIYQTEKNQAYR